MDAKPTNPRPYECGQWIPAQTRHCLTRARLYPAGWLCEDHSPATRRARDEAVTGKTGEPA
jgi:hypothetical protein